MANITEEQKYEKIERYLDGSLSEQELEAFETQIEADEELKKEIARHRTSHLVLEYATYLKDKERLSAIDRELETQEASVTISSRSSRIILLRRIAAAASVLFVAGVAVWIWASATYSQGAVAKQLFAETELEVKRSSGPIAEMPNDVQLLLAQDHFRAGEYNEAIEIYNRVGSTNSDLRFKAQWNLIVTSIANGSCDFNCEYLITSLAEDPRHPYQERAAQLVEKRGHFFYRLLN